MNGNFCAPQPALLFLKKRRMTYEVLSSNDACPSDERKSQATAGCSVQREGL